MKQQVEQYIDNLIQNQMLKDKEIFVFGANASGMTMINALLARGFKISRVLDNNPQMQGKLFLDCEIVLPETTLQPLIENAVILIASRYYEEMKKQLELLGYRENKHIFQVVALNKNATFDVSEVTINKHKQLVLEGMEVYGRLINKYGTDIVLMSPIKPIGDVYVICSYLNQFIERMYQNQSVIFTVVGKANVLTAKLFNIENIELLSEEDNDRLVALANLLPEKIKLLTQYHNYQEIYHHLDGYRGLTFVEEIKHGLLNLQKDTKPELPEVTKEVEKIVPVIEQYGLKKGKSVIIAPYANSIPLIKDSFWEALVLVLREKGYKVFTNCGTPDETPIKGSERIYFSFEDAVAICEYAGTVISYRSGFCEIIGSSKCKKIIIYPDHIKGHSTLRVLFGMEDAIYEQEQLYQIENTFEYTEQLLNEVMRCFVDE